MSDLRLGWVIAAAALCGLGTAFGGYAATEQAESDEGALALSEDPVALAQTEDSDGFQKGSFWFFGTSNYHLRLDESEAQVDGMLDRPLGLILPRWERPTTFKDWCDDFMVWDLWGGYGRDINEKLSWSIYGGGGAGTIENSDDYFPLLIPIELDMDFTRRSLMVGSSVSYFPWGRPVKGERGFWNAVRCTRRVTEMNVGFNRQVSIGDMTVKLPFIGRVFHYKMEDTYNLFWASPRIGIETPITKQDSFSILTGYLFFHDHADEYNGILLEFLVRHRFKR